MKSICMIYPTDGEAKAAFSRVLNACTNIETFSSHRKTIEVKTQPVHTVVTFHSNIHLESLRGLSRFDAFWVDDRVYVDDELRKFLQSRSTDPYNPSIETGPSWLGEKL